MESDQGKPFVGEIPRETNEETLNGHFSKYGDVLGSVIARERISKTLEVLAFGCFPYPPQLIKHLEMFMLYWVEVEKAIPRSEQLRGLSASLTEEEFKNYFERFGQIMDVVVMHDNITNRPRGFGFVTFDSEETVEYVMKNNFHELNGRLVEVKRAVPKEEISNTTCNYNPRVGAGEESPYLISPYGYGPGYASPPSYLPLRVYNGGGVYLPGAGFYGGAYPPIVAHGRYGYGVPHFAPKSPFYGPFMIPYGNTLTFPAHMIRGFGGVSTVAGGYNGIVDAGVNKIEETKLGAVVSAGLNGSDDGATCEGDKKGLDGKFKV